MKVRSENFQRHLLETLGAGSTHQCHGCESECESGSLAGFVIHGIFAYRLDQRNWLDWGCCFEEDDW